ncbi:BEL1-like homeodomain protein 1 [Hibiscus syriacus]|uniref:BEL1-like homeodomain protein 1 n=1 Tax=Hibiscus syriacus TaxID=106335 RepID=A0A6A3CP27_HIBSY|nr:BEL1-like homeodomain protein 1 [Hibiscus syriacus]
MATYCHGNPEIQAADGLQTLVLMNPAYVQYSENPPPPPNNLVYLNSNSISPHAPSPHTQQLVGIPLPAATSAANQGHGSIKISPLHGLVQRAAQELLDEVVTVYNTDFTKNELAKKGSGDNSNNSMAIGESSVVAAGDGYGDGETDAKHVAELTTAEKQEIQMKKAKLISMLDEVGQRYRQYHHQMQVVISSFEQAAGIGSAKTYTSLALKTISKQFGCLKDAITRQIRAANKSLGEEDCLGGKIEVSSTLKFPKDSDKIMLAKQTGLTRIQVSKWFINARVRIWKPMVEEMYMEEIKEQEQNGSDEKTSKSHNNEDSTSKSTAPDNMAKSFSSNQDNIPNQNGSSMSISMASTSPLSGNQ